MELFTRKWSIGPDGFGRFEKKVRGEIIVELAKVIIVSFTLIAIIFIAGWYQQFMGWV